MPILKCINGRNCNLIGLKHALEYIVDSRKTPSGFISGVGVLSAETAFQQMKTTKLLYRKIDRRQWLHSVFSFKGNSGVSPKDAHEIACKTAMYYGRDFQILIATHENTKHPHCHLIMNSVNVRTGRKFSQSKKQLEDYKQFFEEKFNEWAESKGHTKWLPLENHLFVDDEPEINMEQVYPFTEVEIEGVLNFPLIEPIRMLTTEEKENMGEYRPLIEPIRMLTPEEQQQYADDYIK